MSVRAKFRLQSKKTYAVYGGQGYSTNAELTFSAIGADEVPENQRFHKYTPGGTLTINIDNPSAVEFFEANPIVYLDFTAAEK
jgi:hypothetical protein